MDDFRQDPRLLVEGLSRHLADAPQETGLAVAVAVPLEELLDEVVGDPPGGGALFPHEIDGGVGEIAAVGGQ